MNRFVFFLALATLTGLFYVYEEVEAVKIGYTIRQQEEIRAAALDRDRAFKYNIARLKAPQTLERKLLAQRVQLESPKTWKTLVLAENGGVQKAWAARPWIGRPNFFGKFLVGTAQAEAKESSSQ